ncbi:hypothetical protein F8M41_000203 [Gigaspora margarita]|uniref:Serine protease n=1 Tax=Gigaspora margarita TaxID=4874 RepID=A0A8H3XI06_GIGMA|nr:hypothetical protein F8M41_000203 [Gigaspora margarita]
MKPYLNLLSFVEVKNSLSKLNELFNQVNTLVKKFNVINVIISTEYKVNNIVIYLDQPELYQAFINSTKKLNPIPIIDSFNEAIKETSPTLKSRKNNSPILESRENNSSTLESREIQVRILGGYGVGQINNETGLIGIGTAGFWVRQQGLAYLTTVGHSALNATLGPYGAVRFFFVIPNTGPDQQFEFFGDMFRFDVRPVDRGFILPFDDDFVERPFIYNKEFPRAPLFAIADFTHTPDHAKKEVVLPNDNGVVEYEDQILISPMSAYGDSGSPVFTFIDPFSLGPLRVHLYGMIVATGLTERGTLVTPLYQILDSDMALVTIQG